MKIDKIQQGFLTQRSKCSGNATEAQACTITKKSIADSFDQSFRKNNNTYLIKLFKIAKLFFLIIFMIFEYNYKLKRIRKINE